MYEARPGIRAGLPAGLELPQQTRELGAPDKQRLGYGVQRELAEYFFFSSRRRHTILQGDWSSDVCSSDLGTARRHPAARERLPPGRGPRARPIPPTPPGSRKRPRAHSTCECEEHEMTDAIGATAAAGATSAASTPATTGAPAFNAMGSDAFLKLLVAQLKYQDPTHPMDGTQMLGQTAQF